MKRSAFFLLLLANPSLYGQPLSQERIVYPQVLSNPNHRIPDRNLPPAPNPIDPYDPKDVRTDPELVGPNNLSNPLGKNVTDANGAAMHFLNIIDNQVYDGAWRDAGGIMQDIVPLHIWAEGMRMVRNPLGHVRARKVIHHHRRSALRGGLVGEIMVFTFETEFSYKPNSIETVTLMMHPPVGIWKVISYNVQ